LFGFDTGVISGAILLLENDFSLSSFEVELIVSIALVGMSPFRKEQLTIQFFPPSFSSYRFVFQALFSVLFAVRLPIVGEDDWSYQLLLFSSSLVC